MMTVQEAAKTLGANAQRDDVRRMVAALCLHPWSNSPEEYQRLMAGKLALRQWRAFERECEQLRLAAWRARRAA
jgi:hypothetical protein